LALAEFTEAARPTRRAVEALMTGTRATRGQISPAAQRLARLSCFCEDAIVCASTHDTPAWDDQQQRRAVAH